MNKPGKTEQGYLAEITPQLEDLEKERAAIYAAVRKREKKIYPIAKKITPFTLCVDLIIFVLTFTPLVTTLTLWAPVWFYCELPAWGFHGKHKKIVLSLIAKQFGNFSYEPKGTLPMGFMQPSLIVPSHQSYKSRNYFAGSYRGTTVRFAQINLNDEKFVGIALLFTLPKNRFKGHTVVIKDRKTIAQKRSPEFYKLERVKIADPEFEEEFDVYSNDQMEARYLLHPYMIEKIKNMAAHYDAASVRLACYKGHMLILLEAKGDYFMVRKRDYFQLTSLATKATDEGDLLRFRKEIAQILGIIDYMEGYDPLRDKSKNTAVISG